METIDVYLDRLELDELTHVCLDGHWISPFIFDGQFGVDIRGQVVEIWQHTDEGPDQDRKWQPVKQGTQLFDALKEAIEREHKEIIRDAIAELDQERSLARRIKRSWW